MIRAIRGPIAGLLVIAVVLVIGLVTDHRVLARTMSVTHAAVTTSTVVCPDVYGNGPYSSTRLSIADPAHGSGGRIVEAALSGKKTTFHRLPTAGYSVKTATTPMGAVAVTATGPAAVSFSAQQISLADGGPTRGLSEATCDAPRADWWFVGADGRVGHQDVLHLANPSPTAATVRVSLISTQPRPTVSPALSAIVVPPEGVVDFEISKIAPDAPNLAIHVHAEQGLIAAALRESRVDGVTPRGSDWIPPSVSPSRSSVIAGFVAGPGDRLLEVGNPGKSVAVVHLELVTQNGSFAPNGQSRIDVAGGETVAVDLSTALKAQPGAVAITSSRPVVAGAVAVTTLPRELHDLLWRSTEPPLAVGDTWSQGWTREGRDDVLSLAAPTAAATVVVRDAFGKMATLRVPARETATFNLGSLLKAPAAGPQWVSVASVTGGPVYGVQTVWMSGAHGPLLTGAPPSMAPRSIRVPAVVDDLSLAAGR